MAGSDRSRVVSAASGRSVSVPVPPTEGTSNVIAPSRAIRVSRNVAWRPTRYESDAWPGALDTGAGTAISTPVQQPQSDPAARAGTGTGVVDRVFIAHLSAGSSAGRWRAGPG